jgi:cellobiose-specific phosphotransferase system component IIC
MATWYAPFKSRFFATGMMLLAFMAFFLLWAVGNRGPQVYLPIVTAMFAVGSLQAVYGEFTPCRVSDTADYMDSPGQALL